MNKKCSLGREFGKSSEKMIRFELAFEVNKLLS